MIKDVVLFPVKNHKTIKANGYFTIDDKWKAKFMLMLGPKGLFVTFPADTYDKKQEDGSMKKMYAKHFEPISKEANAEVQQEVLKVWQEKNGGGYQQDTPELQVQPSNESLVPF